MDRYKGKRRGGKRRKTVGFNGRGNEEEGSGESGRRRSRSGGREGYLHHGIIRFCHMYRARLYVQRIYCQSASRFYLCRYNRQLAVVTNLARFVIHCLAAAVVAI